MKYFLFFLPVIFLSPPTYGPEYNPERVKRGIPIIEEGWEREGNLYDSVKKISYNSNHIMSDMEVNGYHDYKLILIKNDSIIEESDCYQRYENGHSTLFLKYNYRLNGWDSTVFKRVGPKSKEDFYRIRIDMVKADSILASWGLSRTGKPESK